MAQYGVQSGHKDVPDAARIAGILRGTQPWPQQSMASVSPVDLAQRLVSQQRQSMERSAVHAPLLTLSCPGALAHAPQAMANIANGGEVNQLAERVSVLLAGLQSQHDSQQKDMDYRLDTFGTKVDLRLTHLEARMIACEDRTTAIERNDVDSPVFDAARIMRDSRTQMQNALTEVQSQWRAHHAELRSAQHEQSMQLQELGAHLESQTRKTRQVEQTLDDHERKYQRSEEELQSLLACNPPGWFRELESAVAVSERRTVEHLQSAEAHVGRFRMDMDGLRMRLEAVRDEMMGAVEGRLAQESERMSRSQRQGPATADPAQAAVDRGTITRLDRQANEFVRRLDDADARGAAIKLRVDAHDTRFASIGERAETVCQQAVEGAKGVATEQREEILSEVDCQLRILRQRIEAIGQLCEELSMREMRQASRRPPGGVLEQGES